MGNWCGEDNYEFFYEPESPDQSITNQTSPSPVELETGEK
jgi:hypothetical protein